MDNKKNMTESILDVLEKRTIRGREMYVGVTTEELITLLKQWPDILLQCEGVITRWVRYDHWHHRIGITDNNYFDWYSQRDFRKYYGDWYWFFTTDNFL